MQINISSPHIPLDFESFKEHIRNKLEPLDHHLEYEIRIINVHLTDVNGPKGGHDKVCRLQAHILNHPSINSEGRHGDLIVAIGMAARRMDRALSSVLDVTRNRNPKSHHERVTAAYENPISVAEEVNV